MSEKKKSSGHVGSQASLEAHSELPSRQNASEYYQSTLNDVLHSTMFSFIDAELHLESGTQSDDSDNSDNNNHKASHLFSDITMRDGYPLSPRNRLDRSVRSAPSVWHLNDDEKTLGGSASSIPKTNSKAPSSAGYSIINPIGTSYSSPSLMEYYEIDPTSVSHSTSSTKRSFTDSLPRRSRNHVRDDLRPQYRHETPPPNRSEIIRNLPTELYGSSSLVDLATNSSSLNIPGSSSGRSYVPRVSPNSRRRSTTAHILSPNTIEFTQNRKTSRPIDSNPYAEKPLASTPLETPATKRVSAPNSPLSTATGPFSSSATISFWPRAYQIMEAPAKRKRRFSTGAIDDLRTSHMDSLDAEKDEYADQMSQNSSYFNSEQHGQNSSDTISSVELSDTSEPGSPLSGLQHSRTHIPTLQLNAGFSHHSVSPGGSLSSRSSVHSNWKTPSSSTRNKTTSQFAVSNLQTLPEEEAKTRPRSQTHDPGSAFGGSAPSRLSQQNRKNSPRSISFHEQSRKTSPRFLTENSISPRQSSEHANSTSSHHARHNPKSPRSFAIHSRTHSSSSSYSRTSSELSQEGAWRVPSLTESPTTVPDPGLKFEPMLSRRYSTRRINYQRGIDSDDSDNSDEMAFSTDDDSLNDSVATDHSQYENYNEKENSYHTHQNIPSNDTQQNFSSNGRRPLQLYLTDQIESPRIRKHNYNESTSQERPNIPINTRSSSEPGMQENSSSSGRQPMQLYLTEQFESPLKRYNSNENTSQQHQIAPSNRKSSLQADTQENSDDFGRQQMQLYLTDPFVSPPSNTQSNKNPSERAFYSRNPPESPPQTIQSNKNPSERAFYSRNPPESPPQTIQSNKNPSERAFYFRNPPESPPSNARSNKNPSERVSNFPNQPRSSGSSGLESGTDRLNPVPNSTTSGIHGLATKSRYQLNTSSDSFQSDKSDPFYDPPSEVRTEELSASQDQESFASYISSIPGRQQSLLMKASVGLVTSYQSIQANIRKRRDQAEEGARKKAASAPYYYPKKDEMMHNNQYRVIGYLGKGSFGVVVKAIYVGHENQYLYPSSDRSSTPHPIPPNTLVAIKIARKGASFLQQGRREAMILDHIRSQKSDQAGELDLFVATFDNFFHEGHLCIVFELLADTLFDLVKYSWEVRPELPGLSLRMVRKMTHQLLCALITLKNLKIIHCDLKPENIALTQPNKPRLKVLDFGSSSFVSDSHHNQFPYIQSRYYRAPEVLLGTGYSCSIDMWSLGCIIAELYLGRPLFEGRNSTEQLYCIIDILNMPPQRLLKNAVHLSRFFHRRGFDQDGNSILEPVLPHYQFGGSSLRELIESKPEPNTPQHVNYFNDMLSRMLEWDPEKRISPVEAINHNFILYGPKSSSD